MNKDIVILRESIKKLVPMLAGRGLQVTQVGTQAYVAPNPVTGLPARVNIPSIPDNAEPDFIAAIQGFIDHEVSHVLYTDFLVGRGVKSQRLHELHNAMEDTMIERRMGEDFPGSRKNIAKLRDHFLAKITQPALDSAKDDKERFAYLLIVLLRALAGHEEFRRFMDDGNHWKNPYVKTVMEGLKPSTIKSMPTLTTTVETFEIAKELEPIIYPPPPPAPPMPSECDSKDEDKEPQDGDDENEDQDEQKGSGSDSSEGESEDKPEKEAGEGDGDGERDHSKQEEGDNDDEASGDAESDDDAGDEDSDTGSDGSDRKEDDQDGDGSESDEAGEGEESDDQEDESSGAGDDDSDEAQSEEDRPGDAGGDDDCEEQDADGESSDDASGEDESDQGEADDGKDDASEPDGEESSSGSQPDEREDDGADESGEAEGSEGDGDTDDGDGEKSEDLGDGGVDVALEIDSDHYNQGQQEEPEKTDRDGVAGVGYAGPTIFQTDPVDEEDLADKDMSRALAVLIQKEVIDAIGEADYSVFTRDFDRIVPLPVPDTFKDKHISEMEEKTNQMTATMSKEIERMMAAQSRVFNIGGMRSGRLNGPALHRAAAGDPRIFGRKEEIKAKDTAVTLLCDCSGSMNAHGKIETAMMAAYALCQTLTRVNIPNEVLGFTTWQINEEHGPWRTKDFEAFNEERNKEPNIYGFCRIEPLYIPIFKDFDKRLDADAKRRFAYMPKTRNVMMGNTDGESLEYAAIRLMKRREKRKVMMVLSDGHPAGARNDAAHLRMMTTKLTKMGIELVGIGIKDHAVSRFYDKYLVLNDVQDLPTAVMKELRAILTK